MAAAVLVGLAVVYILGAYSSAARPIWIDEFLHFALGSHHSSSEAWRSISETVPNLNHGQTGVYMMVNYWTLRVTGASAFWLRLPSLVAAAFLLFSSVSIGRRVGFTPIWVLLLLAAYFAETNLMFYAGEARPYMPLAACAVGTLSFYLVAHTVRTTGSRLLGAAAIVLGVLVHPYFPVYWLSMAVFGYMQYAKPGSLRALVCDFMRHCDLLISIPAVLAFLILSKLTWMRGSPDFHLDPFQYFRPQGLIIHFTRFNHFEFLGRYFWAGISLLVAAASAFIIPSLRRNPAYRRLAQPLCLIALALMVSVFLSLICYHRRYWIVPRQWVASMAIVCLGYTWFLFELSRFLATLTRRAHLYCLIAMVIVVGHRFPGIHQSKSNDLRACLRHFGRQSSPVCVPASEVPLSLPANNDEWVAAANANIRVGGPVWPLFRKFYGRGE